MGNRVSIWRVEAIFNRKLRAPRQFVKPWTAIWGTYLPLGLLNFRQDDTEGLDDFQKFDFDGRDKSRVKARKNLSRSLVNPSA